MRVFPLIFITLLSWLVAPAAQAIVLIAADLPPYVIRAADGTTRGVAVEIVEEAARRLHEPLTITVMPLARALSEAQYQTNALLIPPVRSSQREHLYRWITPLLDEDFVVVSHRDFYPEPLKVAMLKHLRIGTLRNSFGNYLVKLRLKVESETVATETLNAQKLERGRIQAWVAAWNVINYIQKQTGLARENLVRGDTLMHTQLFLAAHKDFPLKETIRWQTVIQTMREDGSLRQILKKYDYQLPE